MSDPLLESGSFSISIDTLFLENSKLACDAVNRHVNVEQHPKTALKLISHGKIVQKEGAGAAFAAPALNP